MDYGAAVLPVPAIPSEAWAWALSCDSSPVCQNLYAIGRLISRLKARGQWSKWPLIIFMCGDELTAGSITLKGHCNPSFVGNILTVSGLGTYSADGASYIDLGIKTSDIAGFGPSGNADLEFIVEDIPTGYGDCGAAGGGPIVQGRWRNGTRMYIWNFSASPAQLDIGSAVGLNGSIRLDANNILLVKDGVTTAAGQAATGTPTSDYFLFKSGGSVGYGTAPKSFHFFGNKNVTAQDAADLKNIIEGYHADMGTLATIRAPAAPPYKGPFYFTQAMLGQSDIPNLRVYAQAAVPSSDAVDNTTYPLFPLSVAMIRFGTAPTWTRSDIGLGWFLWANRARGPQPGVITKPYLRGNDPNTYGGAPKVVNSDGVSVQARVTFDSFNESAVATWTQLARGIKLRAFDDPDYQPGGVPTGWVQIAAQAFDVSIWNSMRSETSDPETDANFITDANIYTGAVMHAAYMQANLKSLFSNPSLAAGNDLEARSIVPLAPFRISDYTGVLGVECDTEELDGRPSDQLANYMMVCADICAAKGLYFAVQCDDPAGKGKSAGFDANSIWQILTKSNVIFNITLSRANMDNAGGAVAEINRWLSYMAGPAGDKAIPYEKLRMSVGIGSKGQEITQQQALDLHAWCKQNGVHRFQIVPVGANFAAPGTAVQNQRKATVLGIAPASS